jgi:transcriptional regulator with XRE-family HTH domain
MEKTIYTREYAAMLKLLRDTRKRTGVTQVELSSRLEISQSFLSKLERGDRRIDLVQLRSILVALGVPLADFIRSFERDLARST